MAYTAYNTAGTNIGSGTISFTVTGRTSSSYYSDVTSASTGSWSANAVDFMLWRDHKYLDAIYDVVFWYMLVGGCIVLLLTVPMFTSMILAGKRNKLSADSIRERVRETYV